MDSITIRNIDKQLKARLHAQAVKHGRSVEDEVCHILRAALKTHQGTEQSTLEAIREALGPGGGIDSDFERLPREPIAQRITFD